MPCVSGSGTTAYEHMKSTKKAYAKINLYLDVMAKREDGYHDIKSVMLQVGLYDEVTVERDGGVDIRLLDLCGELPDGEENIAYRCADAFLRYYDLREGVTIRLKKRIPIAAGLGGGSSDGAAVLSAMAELFADTIPTDLDTLCAIGSTVGADIPFCIVGGCAKTLGIGDRITPLDYHPQCAIVLARGGEVVSTPQAYRLLDRQYEDALASDFGDFEGFLASLAHDDRLPQHMHNTFESVILPLHPEAAHIHRLLRDKGGVSLMSGSGPTVFGLFDDPEKARAAYETLVGEGTEAYLTGAISRI